MQREDVEQLIEKLMEAEYRPEVIYQDEDKYHLPADAAEALRALLDRAEKAEAEVAKLRADGGAEAEPVAWARAQERAAQVPASPGFLEALSAEELLTDEDGDIRVGEVVPD